jgi:hypothetical protein
VAASGDLDRGKGQWVPAGIGLMDVTAGQVAMRILSLHGVVFAIL